MDRNDHPRLDHVHSSGGVFRPPDFINFSHLTSAAQPGLWEAGATVVSLLFTLNLLLLVFNLIPLPPLDGAAVVSGLVPAARKVRDQLLASGFGGLIGLIVAIAVMRKGFWPLFRIVLGWLFGGP